MSMKIITGSTGTTHVTSNNDGEFNEAIFGTGLVILPNGNKLSARIVDNNTIDVSDGDIVFQGRHALIEPNTTETVTIDTGAIDKNRIDLIVAHYEMDSETGYESLGLKVIKGTESTGMPTMPKITEGVIRTGAKIAEAVLFKVTLNGISLSSVEQVAKLIDGINDSIEANAIAIATKADKTEVDKNAQAIANSKPNLIPFPYYDGMSKTVSGITFTVNADGSITANGTATNNATFFLNNDAIYADCIGLIGGEKYTLVDNNNAVGCYLAIGKVTSANVRTRLGDTQSDKNYSFVAESGFKYGIRVSVDSGASLNNVVIKPMLVEGAIAPTEFKMFGNMTCVGTLASGETTLELVSDKIKATSLIDTYFYATDGTAIEPISYSTIKVEAGKVTMTFDALESNLNVGIRII